MRSILLAAALVASAAPPALAQEPDPAGQKVVQVTKVFRYLDTFLEVPFEQRSKIKVVFQLLRDGSPAPGLHPALIDGEQRIPLPLSATGRFERLPTLDQLHRKLKLMVDAPQDAKLGMNITIESAVPPAQEMSAADVATSIAQVNGTVKSAVGALAILAPKFVKASFPGGGSGVAITADGRQIPLSTGKKGAPTYQPDVQKGAVKLRFSRTPSKVDLLPANEG